MQLDLNIIAIIIVIKMAAKEDTLEGN